MRDDQGDLMPRSVAVQGAARKRRGIPGVAGSDADKPEIDVLGGLSSVANAFFPAPPQGGFTEEQYNPPAPLPAPVDPKAEQRAATAAVATTTAQAARTDPAGGTKQGANQPYTGTGDTKSKTGSTGGVTTGAPGGGHVQVKLPSGEMADYGDPRIEASFGGKGDTFMKHSDRASPGALQGERAPAPSKVRSAIGDYSTETTSAVPLAAQLENWDRYVRGREAEGQAFNTGMAQSQAAEQVARAGGRRAEVLAEQPFLTEELAAKGKIGEADIKARTEEAQRKQITTIVEQYAQNIDKLRMSPQYQSAPPEQKKAMEDQIADQARLTLSALTRTNLYPRPDPYSILGSFGAGQAPAPEAKPGT